MVFSMSFWLRVSRGLESFSLRLGQCCAWLALLLVLLMAAVVVLRYGFGFGSLALQDAVLYTHAALFMLAMGYALAKDRHVRVDIFYHRWSPRTQAKVNIASALLFALPLCAALFWLSWDYVLQSWQRREGSSSSGLGLTYLLKTLLLVMPVMLGLQALSQALRDLLTLCGHSPAPSRTR